MYLFVGKLTDALIIQGDGTDINILEEEGLNSMDAFIGATGFDEAKPFDVSNS